MAAFVLKDSLVAPLADTADDTFLKSVAEFRANTPPVTMRVSHFTNQLSEEATR